VSRDTLLAEPTSQHPRGPTGVPAAVWPFRAALAGSVWIPRLDPAWIFFWCMSRCRGRGCLAGSRAACERAMPGRIFLLIDRRSPDYFSRKEKIVEIQ